MKPRKLHRLFAAALMALPPAAAVAADPWQVTAEAASEVKAFKHTSMAVEDMQIYDMGNWMVYGGTVHDRTPLLPIYDLLACFHITHPESRMDVESGGGIQVIMDQVQFAKGKWDATLRLTEHERIEMLDKKRYLLLDVVRVGASDLKQAKYKIGVVRMMARACLPKGAPTPPKTRPKGG